MKISKSMEQKIERFALLVKGIVQGWMEAGKALVEMIDEDPQAFDKIREKYPQLSVGMLVQLEAVGRGVLHEKLLTASGPGPNALRRMPYSSQVKLLEVPVELVVENEQGTDTLLVDVHNLTSRQASQVFAEDHVRSQGEQKAWLVAQRTKAMKGGTPTQAPAWVIRSGRVFFNEAASFSAGELATIITQLTK